MSRASLLKTGVCILLICACLFTFFSCDDYYDPIDSIGREDDVIAEIDDYEVNYELFRFLFMSRIDEYDGGDRTKWSGSDGAALWQSAVKDVVADICDIYAVFAVCSDYGIDPESNTIDTMVNENIVLDIDGGVMANGTVITGYGDIETYEAAIRANYSNDAVHRLLYRYKACLELLDNYIVNEHGGGEITVSNAHLTAMLNSEEVVHVNRVFASFYDFGTYNRELALEKAQKLYQNLLDANGNYEVMVSTAFNKTVSDGGIDPARGWWFGKYSTSERDYPNYYNAIFSTPEGEISGIIEERDGFYIVYGMGTDADLEDEVTRESLTELYLQELYWKKIAATAKAMKSSISYTDDFYDMTVPELIEGE